MKPHCGSKAMSQVGRRRKDIECVEKNTNNTVDERIQRAKYDSFTRNRIDEENRQQEQMKQ
jgi:hypothetical protein